MNVVSPGEALPKDSRGVDAAIGFFDGVHLGHQQVIRQALRGAAQHGTRSLVITFDRHPKSVLSPAHAPALIYSLPQRLNTLATLQPEAALVLPFTLEFSRLSAEDFVRLLQSQAGPIRSLSVGNNFTFGHGRSGNVALLSRLGTQLGFAVQVAEAVQVAGEPVSSTRIREIIRRGNLPLAGTLLGRPYSLSATVVAGDRLGRQIGFPTANLAVDGLVLPPHGVYAAQARHEGRLWPAVLNLGVRPTIASARGELRLEVHLLGFNGDLYGHSLEVSVGRKLREERKFASVEELKRQIQTDAAAALGPDPTPTSPV
jgi:riboflavin kinase/FMN adenylyltransferase